jgi:hypothetical protein
MNWTRRGFLYSPALLSAPAAPSHCDVAVYSGVPCGIAASIAAAREGARVLLIEPTRHIGGLSTSGINTAESEHMLIWTIGGIALEFNKRLGDHYQTGKPEFCFESSVAEKLYLAMLEEEGVEVRYGQRVERVQATRGRISSIQLSGGSLVSASVFVDAGYEGDLMARAGVPCTYGRESRAEFNEEAAGVRFERAPVPASTVDSAGRLLPGITAWASELKQGDARRGVMNYNFRPTFAKDPAWKVPIPKPERYDPARSRCAKSWTFTPAATASSKSTTSPRRLSPPATLAGSLTIPALPTSAGRRSSPTIGITRSASSTSSPPIRASLSRYRRKCVPGGFIARSSRITATSPISSMSAKPAA